MLFNSFPFIFAFVPLVFAGFFAFEAAGRHRWALAWLMVCSMGFYAYWKPPYLLLLMVSIVFNYTMARALYRVRLTGDMRRSRVLLAARIAVNLAVLAYFKYATFFASMVNGVARTHFVMHGAVLPLGISFYTFTEIAYLVDIYQLRAKPGPLLDYCLFVTFFPHLIAGPIVHYRQLMPQFDETGRRTLLSEDAVSGGSWASTIFVIGLFKKVVIADGVAVFASPMFDTFLPHGAVPSLLPAWGAALAYTFQLYFDFSGYSDMAIGLARVFGIRFPLNFNSPYKATSIIDFWRRWHMTLSAFLRDYLYVPLGGNRRGQPRRVANVLITMTLGGLWHGAGWTFVLWGLLHGVYLLVNHAWRAVRQSFAGAARAGESVVAAWASRMLTFVCVVAAWVLFRAHSIVDAGLLLRGMSGQGGIVLPRILWNRMGGLNVRFVAAGIRFEALDVRYFAGLTEVAWLAALFLVVMIFPNTQELMGIERSRARIWPVWTPSRQWALACAAAFTVSLATLAANSASEFLYFNF